MSYSIDQQQRQEIAQTIAKQLGGANKLKAMVNAKYFCCLSVPPGLQFRFSGSKIANHVKIELNSMDTYDVTFMKIGNAPKFNITNEQTFKGIYNDMLINLFEQTTKLYITL